MTKSYINPTIAEVDTDLWTSMRELKRDIQAAADRIWTSADPPFHMLLPENWAYGYVNFVLGLTAGDSKTIDAEWWGIGDVAANSIFTNEPISNPTGGFGYFVVTSPVPLTSDWIQLTWSYTGAKVGAGVYLTPTRRH